MAVDMEAVHDALDTSDGGLDAAAVAELNKTETLVAVLEELDQEYNLDAIEQSDRVPHAVLRRILAGTIERRPQESNGGGGS